MRTRDGRTRGPRPPAPIRLPAPLTIPHRVEMIPVPCWMTTPEAWAEIHTYGQLRQPDPKAGWAVIRTDARTGAYIDQV